MCWTAHTCGRNGVEPPFVILFSNAKRAFTNDICTQVMRCHVQYRNLIASVHYGICGHFIITSCFVLSPDQSLPAEGLVIFFEKMGRKSGEGGMGFGNR